MSSAVNFSDNVAAVMLAAGASRRLGRSKQMLRIGGETLVERAVRVAVEAGLKPVIVVVRSEGELAESLRAKGLEVVVNEAANEGMASSIRCGVERAEQMGAEGLVVMACDQVGLTAKHLRTLWVVAERITGSAYAGKVGIPAYFPRAAFGQLMGLRGDVGARGMLRGAASVGDEGLALDIDTEADVELALERFGPSTVD